MGDSHGDGEVSDLEVCGLRARFDVAPALDLLAFQLDLLGTPLRLRLLAILAGYPRLGFGDLARILDCPVSEVASAVTPLYASGFVTLGQNGRAVFVELGPNPVGRAIVDMVLALDGDMNDESRLPASPWFVEGPDLPEPGDVES